MKTNLINRAFALVATAALSLLTGCGWNNVETPAGYVGYVTQGAVVGSSRFVGLQTGPTSSGASWMYQVTNISITPYTYDELFDVDQKTGVLAKDQLAVSFGLHITFRIRPDKVKEFVEQYTTLNEKDAPDAIVAVAYKNFVKEPARTAARGEAEKYDGLQIQANLGIITKDIRQSLEATLKGTPFEILNLVIGNIQYPTNVTRAVADKIAAAQDLERQATVLEIVKKVAEQKREEAKGIADAMNTIQSRLTPQYIQYEAIKAQLAMVNSPNHTTIYIPVGPMGVPLVGTVGSSGPDTPVPPPPAK